MMQLFPYGDRDRIQCKSPALVLCVLYTPCFMPPSSGSFSCVAVTEVFILYTLFWLLVLRGLFSVQG